LTFSILQYLIGFIFYPTMKESILCLRITFRLVPMFSGITPMEGCRKTFVQLSPLHRLIGVIYIQFCRCNISAIS
jgi:hypothetical protein